MVTVGGHRTTRGLNHQERSGALPPRLGPYCQRALLSLSCAIFHIFVLLVSLPKLGVEVLPGASDELRSGVTVVSRELESNDLPTQVKQTHTHAQGHVLTG